MPIVSTTKMTAKQFLQLGQDPPGVRLELVDGQVAVSPSPIPEHSYVVFTLARILGQHIEQNHLGELLGDVDTTFGEHDVRRPDVLFFFENRRHLIGKKAILGPPDLCVEVISPGSIDIDREDKFAQYRDHGVAHYWIIDPRLQTIEAWHLKDNQYISSGRAQGAEVISLPPFPDLKLNLHTLWRRK